MTVLYFANLRQLTGCKEEEWTKAAPLLRDLLAGLVAEHGAALGQWLFEGDRLNRWISIFINGRDVVHLKGLETPLNSNDVVTIFPPVAGG